MQLKFVNNSILYNHFLSYQNQKATTNNINLISSNLKDSQIQELYNKKYNLSEFDIYKYITAHDYIVDSLGLSKYTLTEGITTNKNKYNNILIDLFYQNINSQIMCQYSISIVFGIKQTKYGGITDLTRLEKDNNLFKYDSEAHPSYGLNYWTEEYQLYKSIYKNYSGNSYTYYTFKQLLKLFLTEVYLYKLNNHILTYKELGDWYNMYILNSLDPYTIVPMSQWMVDQGVEKVQYHCIKITDPSDINYFSLSHLKLYLIDINTVGDFEQSYESLTEKSLWSFWDYDKAFKNNLFTEKNNWK